MKTADEWMLFHKSAWDVSSAARDTVEGICYERDAEIRNRDIEIARLTSLLAERTAMAAEAYKAERTIKELTEKIDELVAWGAKMVKENNELRARLMEEK